MAKGMEDCLHTGDQGVRGLRRSQQFSGHQDEEEGGTEEIGAELRTVTSLVLDVDDFNSPYDNTLVFDASWSCWATKGERTSSSVVFSRPILR